MNLQICHNKCIFLSWIIIIIYRWSYCIPYNTLQRNEPHNQDERNSTFFPVHFSFTSNIICPTNARPFACICEYIREHAQLHLNLKEPKINQPLTLIAHPACLSLSVYRLPPSLSISSLSLPASLSHGLTLFSRDSWHHIITVSCFLTTSQVRWVTQSSWNGEIGYYERPYQRKWVAKKLNVKRTYKTRRINVDVE